MTQNDQIISALKRPQPLSDKMAQDLAWTVGIPMHLDPTQQSENIEDRRNDPPMGTMESWGRQFWDEIKKQATKSRIFYPPPKPPGNLPDEAGYDDIKYGQ